MASYKDRILSKIISIILINAFLISDASFAFNDPRGSALAPPYATKPPCQIVKNGDKFEVVTNYDSGLSFRESWAFVDISFLIGQMLKIARDEKIQRPKDILKGLIRTHLANRDGIDTALAEGFDIDNIEESGRGGVVTSFSIPIREWDPHERKLGALKLRLFYSLKKEDDSMNGPGARIQIDKDTNVYVDAVQAADLTPDEIRQIIHELNGFATRLSLQSDMLVMDGLDENIFAGFNAALYALKAFKADSSITELLEAIDGAFSDEASALVVEAIRKQLKNSPERDKALANIDVLARVIRLYAGSYLGKEITEKRLVRLNDILMASSIVKESRVVKLVQDTDDTADTEIYTDEVALFEVMRNLISNAVEATVPDRENTITVRTHKSDDMVHIVIDVEDHGSGISEESRAKLFREKFTTKSTGHGIGLPLIERLVTERCDGMITYSTKEGEGTVFSVSLPLENPQEKLAIRPSPHLNPERAHIDTPDVESERLHAIHFRDFIPYARARKYIQAQPEGQPLIIALGTDWIEGYEKGEEIYDMLNPLISSIRTYCERKKIPLVSGSDEALVDLIANERSREGYGNAKVLVLAGKSSVATPKFKTLREDKDHGMVIGIDSKELAADKSPDMENYIRLMEMLTIGLKLIFREEVNRNKAPFTITEDEELGIFVFTLHSEPVNIELLRKVYDAQWCA